METKQRYPLSLLRLCYALFADAAFTEYQQLLEEAKGIICDGNDPNLLGEWELIAAFQDFPNLEKNGTALSAGKTPDDSAICYLYGGRTVFVRQYFHVAAVLYKAGRIGTNRRNIGTRHEAV